MYLFQASWFHLISPAPFDMFNGPDLGSTHMQDLTPAPHSSSWARQQTALVTFTSGDMTSARLTSGRHILSPLVLLAPVTPG